MDQATRTCSRCGDTKPLGEFPLRKKGEPQRHSYCRGCKAVMQKSWYERNKARHMRNVTVHKQGYIAENRRIIAEAKNRPCADCGERYPSYVMEFDHVRGEKLGDIARLVTVPVTVEVLLAEIAKCEIVCANCHRDRTHRRRLAGKGEP